MNEQLALFKASLMQVGLEYSVIPPYPPEWLILSWHIPTKSIQSI